MVRNLE
jgi:hypothetical protein